MHLYIFDKNGTLILELKMAAGVALRRRRYYLLLSSFVKKKNDDDKKIQLSQRFHPFTPLHIFIIARIFSILFCFFFLLFSFFQLHLVRPNFHAPIHFCSLHGILVSTFLLPNRLVLTVRTPRALLLSSLELNVINLSVFCVGFYKYR